ncbi:MAG: MFS transporter [Bacilli bacterium]
MNKNPLSRKRMLAFASTDIFGSGSFNIINFLYPGFLALTIGIPAFEAGIIILIARIWDAVTDLIMGAISDRTHSKLGKRRIYLVITSLLVALGLFLLFYPFSFDFLALRFIACLFTYILFATIQTMVMMSGLFFFYIDFIIVRDITAAGQDNIVGLFGAAQSPTKINLSKFKLSIVLFIDFCIVI